MNIDVTGLEDIADKNYSDTAGEGSTKNPFKLLKKGIDKIRSSDTAKTIDEFGERVADKADIQELPGGDASISENFKVLKQNIAEQSKAIVDVQKENLSTIKVSMQKKEEAKAYTKEVFSDLNPNQLKEVTNYLEADKAGRESFNPEIEELAQRIDTLSEEDEKIVRDYYTDRGQKGYAYKYWEGISEGLIQAGDNISDIELKRPPIGIIEAIDNEDYDFLDKVQVSGEIFGKTLFDNTLGNFETEKYLESVGDMGADSMEKLNDAVYREGLTPLERTSKYTLGTLEFMVINPLSALFDEDNSGALTAIVGQGLDAVVIPMKEGVKLGTEIAGGSDELGEDLAGLAEIFAPSTLVKTKLDQIAFNKEMRPRIDELKKELLDITVDPKLAEAYVKAKSTQYGGAFSFDGVDKFDAVIKELKDRKDIEGLQNLQTEIKNFNTEKRAEFTGQIENKLAIEFDKVATKVGAKINFVNDAGVKTDSVFNFNGKFSTYAFGKVGKDFHTDVDIQQGLTNLSDYWTKRGLGGLPKKELDYLIDESVNISFGKNLLTKRQSNNIKENLRTDLKVQQSKIGESIGNIIRIQGDKFRAKNNFTAAKASFAAGKISETQLKVSENAYTRQLDTVADPRKLEELEYQRAIGNMDLQLEGDMYSYKWTPKGREFLPKKLNKQIGLHMPKEIRDALVEKQHFSKIEKNVAVFDSCIT